MTTLAPTTAPDIDSIVARGNLGAERAQHLAAIFRPLFEQSIQALKASSAINVTAADQVTEIKHARKARLALRQIRLDADKHRKEQKESALREAQAIQDVYNNIARPIEIEEERLQACEDFALRAEAARKAALREARTGALKPYQVNPAAYRLEEMSEQEFADLVADLERRKQAFEAEVRQAAERRKADEEKQRVEAERLKAENDRLRAEKARADEEARKERLAAQARADVERQKAEAERRARQKAEADLKAKRDAEAAEQAREESERRRAAAAPDREKMLAFAELIDGLDVPEFSPAAQAARDRLEGALGKFSEWIRAEAQRLGGAD